MSHRPAALLLSFLLFPAAACTAEEPAGEAVWSNACSGCHADTAEIREAIPKADDESGRAKLETFLTRHHAPDEADRAAVIDWLIAQTNP